MNDKLKHLIAGLVIGVTTVTVALLFDSKRPEAWAFGLAIIAGIGKEVFDMISAKIKLEWMKAIKYFDSFDMIATCFGGWIITAITVILRMN